MKRIAIIGNAGGGKTTLSRALSRVMNLPVFHVDSYQYTQGFQVRPHEEATKELAAIHAQDQWIIDGFGPLQILEQRLERADQIIFIDLSLWRHYWWVTKRAIQSLWAPRQELPEACSDLSFRQMRRVYSTLWKVHYKMRPQLLQILKRYSEKTVFIRGPRDFKKIFNGAREL